MIKNQEHVRKPTYPIQPLLLNRWSPRAMSGESMSDDELMPLFEAARWAPSSYNSQPWRFIYAKRETPKWGQLFDLLADANKLWCVNASVLLLILSQKNFERNDKPSPTHSFATGAAFENLCLEGFARGYVVHGIEGFDRQKAKATYHIPDDYKIEAMTVIGKRGDPSSLPQDIREREHPSERKPLKELIFEGEFRQKKIE